MINLTKLICGNVTISEIIKKDADKKASSLHFSSDKSPIVVWNMTRQCNLTCKHCYIQGQDKKSNNELTTNEAKAFIQDLAMIKVPILLFTGGEPLLRKDIFELCEFAANLGLRPVLSTNGILITPDVTQSIKDAGFVYVGVSVDGMEDVHNEFRGVKNGFQLAWEGIRNCMDAELSAGIRFTVNKHNFEDLPSVLDLAVKESIPRFCLYHLVYTGRGKEMIKDDTDIEDKINLINFLVSKASAISNMEILTVDNPADGIYLYLQMGKWENKGIGERENGRMELPISPTLPLPHSPLLHPEQLQEKEFPKRGALEIKTLLEMAGGCSAGQKIANVGPEGEVYPCQFWQDLPLGNIRNTPFSQIWQKKTEMFKHIKTNLKGKCGRCPYKELCGGCRVRAKVIYGDYLAEDPACYIPKEEEMESNIEWGTYSKSR